MLAIAVLLSLGCATHGWWDPTLDPAASALGSLYLKKKDYPKVAPFSSEKEYREAVKEAGGEVPKEGLRAA